MANFECKIKVQKTDKKGKEKDVVETFFVENAPSFSAAEMFLNKYWNDKCEVLSMAISKVMDIVNTPRNDDDGTYLDKVYKAVISSTFTDDEDNEKEMKYPVLVWATTVEDAMEKVREYMKQGLTDMTLVSIAKTKIVEIIQ